jgi:hypothetical protein
MFHVPGTYARRIAEHGEPVFSEQLLLTYTEPEVSREGALRGERDQADPISRKILPTGGRVSPSDRLRCRVRKQEVNDRLLCLHNACYLVRSRDHDVLVIHVFVAAMSQAAAHRGKTKLSGVLRFWCRSG